MIHEGNFKCGGHQGKNEYLTLSTWLNCLLGEIFGISARGIALFILLKNSSHPEDLAAALPIVSRITPDGYGVQAQVLKQLILFTMMKKTMNGTCSKLKIEIIPKTHRVVRLEIIQQ